MRTASGTGSVPATALEVVEVRESSPLDEYLQSTRQRSQRIVDELIALRDTEQALVDELAHRMSEARARLTRYQRAVDALKVEHVAERSAKKLEKKAGKQWTISDEKVAEVLTRFRELVSESTHRAGGITAGFMAEKTPGLSPETARRALDRLREREVVRVVGPSRGGGLLFALMPEDEHGA
jgi:CRP-like cAMP-binding protein